MTEQEGVSAGHCLRAEALPPVRGREEQTAVAGKAGCPGGVWDGTHALGFASRSPRASRGVGSGWLKSIWTI